jgi:hypothetical protein
MPTAARLTSGVGALGSLTTEQCAKSQHAHPLFGLRAGRSEVSICIAISSRAPHGPWTQLQTHN